MHFIFNFIHKFIINLKINTNQNIRLLRKDVLWETLYNSDFKPLEFEGFKKAAGANAFTLSPKKWIEATNAIGIVGKSGRYGGTFAHSDIAFEFASWISPEFKLYTLSKLELSNLPGIEQKSDT